ncbi:hypothetical protein [Demequina sp. SO4-18]|uniref:hypothetical protein n=1 Tax=Demequina sp. SO4-18 TaxID=3401026 RepID=UPI003B5AA1DF
MAGVVIVVGGGIAAVALLLPRVEDAAYAALSGDAGARELETEVPSGWSAVPVMGGTGTVKHDPAWEDVAEYFDAQAMETEMAVQTGVDVAFHGAWLVAGDLEGDSTALVVLSIADVGGASSARLEARAFVGSSTFGIEGAETTSEGPVRTAAGYTGYLAEYEFPMYGKTWPNMVGVVVEGNSQLVVYTLGSSTTGSGDESVEAVLDSLQIVERR